MYCRFCGKELRDDSVYCFHCGQKVGNTTGGHTVESKDNNPKSAPNNAQPVQNKGCLSCGTLFAFAVIGIVLVIILSSTSVIKRDLTRNDYTVKTSQGLTSYSITVTPKKDINSCDVELILYNSKGETIYSDTITKLNLKNGLSYTYTFDFGFLNSLSGYQVKYHITGTCGMFASVEPQYPYTSSPCLALLTV